MQPMKGKWASSRVDLGYTELFFLLEVTSVFWSSDSVLGDSLVFHQANRGSLRFCLGTRDCCAGKAGESSSFTARVMSHGISRVAAGTWGMFSSYGGGSH